MKRLKNVNLDKLAISTTTIRILSEAEQTQAVGGISGSVCNTMDGCGPQTFGRTCSCAAPGGCR